MSPTRDCQAGPLKAVPQPTKKVKIEQKPRRHQPK